MAGDQPPWLPLSWLLVLAVTTSVLGLYFVDGLEPAFFTHDAEVELLAVRSIVDSGFTRVSIPWTHAYDLYQEELLPFGENFLTVHDHRLYASRPLAFLLLCAALYRWLGVAGLYLLPAVAACATFHLGYRLASKLGTGPGQADPVWMVPLLAFTTPLLFYGLCVWSMALGAALAAGALYLLLAGWGAWAPPLSGLVLGFAIAIRPELTLLAVAVAPWCASQLGRKATTGWLVGVAAVVSGVAVLNQAVFGSPLGPHLSGNAVGLATWLETRPHVLHALYLQSLASPWIEGLTAAAGLAALLPSRLGWPGPRARAGLLSFFAVGAGWLALATLRSEDPFAAALSSHSLLACAPFLCFALFFPAGEGRRLRATRWLGAAYLLLTSLSCPPQAAHAAHWGPRILVGFLPVIGVLAFTAAAAFVRAFPLPAVRAAIAVLLVVGLANQAASLRLLFFKKHETATFQEEMELTELPILSGDWLVPADLASWYPDRALWFPRSTQDLERIFVNLARQRQRRLLVVSRDGAPLDRYMRNLAASGRLSAGPRHPIRSRLLHYRNMSAAVYEIAR